MSILANKTAIEADFDAKNSAAIQSHQCHVEIEFYSDDLSKIDYGQPNRANVKMVNLQTGGEVYNIDFKSTNVRELPLQAKMIGAKMAEALSLQTDDTVSAKSLKDRTVNFLAGGAAQVPFSSKDA